MGNEPRAFGAAAVAGDGLMSDEDGWRARFGEAEMGCGGCFDRVPQGLDRAMIGRKDKEGC